MIARLVPAAVFKTVGTCNPGPVSSILTHSRIVWVPCLAGRQGFPGVPAELNKFVKDHNSLLEDWKI